MTSSLVVPPADAQNGAGQPLDQPQGGPVPDIEHAETFYGKSSGPNADELEKMRLQLQMNQAKADQTAAKKAAAMNDPSNQARLQQNVANFYGVDPGEVNLPAPQNEALG